MELDEIHICAMSSCLSYVHHIRMAYLLPCAKCMVQIMPSCLLPNSSFFSWRLWDWWTIPTSFAFMGLLSSHPFSALWQVWLPQYILHPKQSFLLFQYFIFRIWGTQSQSLSFSPTEVRFIACTYQTKVKKPNFVLVPRPPFFHLCYVSHFACKWLKLVEMNDFMNVYTQQFDH